MISSPKTITKKFTQIFSTKPYMLQIKFKQI